MEHSIEVDANGPVAVREPRRDLPTGFPIADSDDGDSPEIVEERPRQAWSNETSLTNGDG
jgi:hypothetical protein